jgi:hypothetical protein
LAVHEAAIYIIKELVQAKREREGEGRREDRIT